MMDELIGRLVADSGVDRTAALGAVGIIADLPLEGAPLEKAQIEILRRRRVSATEATWRITSFAVACRPGHGRLARHEHAARNRHPRHFDLYARAGKDAVGGIVDATPALGRCS
jgi:hypothetical protein